MLTTFEQLAATRRPLHLAIGMFDGLHLGHQSVIEMARHAARSSRGLHAVLTFDPHPSVVLRPDQPTLLMMTAEAKRWKLQELGLDGCIVHPFDREYARIEASEFLPWLLGKLPNLSTIYVGENWRFGHGRGGDVVALLSHARAAGVSLVTAPRVSLDGEPISSSRIREQLTGGSIALVNRLLGYPFFALGAVVTGRQLGRTLGFPTLNLAWRPELLPKTGVYVVRAALAPQNAGGWSPQWMPGVANYGFKPTVGGVSEPVLEVHVLGACGVGLSDRVLVEWLHFVRPERRFDGLEDLRAAIAADRQTASEWFANW
jgi:riboflavin kinase/FMN adenylyltransferase